MKMLTKKTIIQSVEIFLNSEASSGISKVFWGIQRMHTNKSDREKLF